jgi:hypothetical protein
LIKICINKNICIVLVVLLIRITGNVIISIVLSPTTLKVVIDPWKPEGNRWLIMFLDTLKRTSSVGTMWQNHLRNEGFVTKDQTGGFSVKREYTNTTHKHKNNIMNLSKVITHCFHVLELQGVKLQKKTSKDISEFKRKRKLYGSVQLDVIREITSP